ncbi:glycosyltransferase [Caulobacter sp. S45]|uniref:glycosyltransferase n=1 Tax=Caulobacter sp. S45 TaxID=1641861 RepID=UPI00157752A6|nr:glycosyltransferase [Caulobacter sp. S45]
MNLIKDCILLSRPPVAHGGEALGHAHYSYGFAAGYFERMFAQMGVETQAISHPEQFKTDAFAKAHGLSLGRYVHLMFRSTEHLRPVQGSYNIACFAWEFPVIKTDGRSDEAVVDQQAHMLSLCEEIWTPCSYGVDVLRRNGLENTHYIPAPVPLPDTSAAGAEAAIKTLSLVESMHLCSASAPRLHVAERIVTGAVRPLSMQPWLRQVLSKGGKIFLTVCNPYDLRKNLANLIDGFLIAAQGRSDCVLIVKLATSGTRGEPVGYVHEVLKSLFGNPHALDEAQVILVGGYIPDDQMEALYDLADFYLCSSVAEGQNLPLLEAMGRGCIPVSTRNTAMLDYLQEDCGVIIEERRYLGLIAGTAADVAGKRFEISSADRFQVAAGVRAALELSPAQARTKMHACREVLLRLFSCKAVFEKIMTRLKAIELGFQFERRPAEAAGNGMHRVTGAGSPGQAEESGPTQGA